MIHPLRGTGSELGFTQTAWPVCLGCLFTGGSISSQTKLATFSDSARLQEWLYKGALWPSVAANLYEVYGIRCFSCFLDVLYGTVAFSVNSSQALLEDWEITREERKFWGVGERETWGSET